VKLLLYENLSERLLPLLMERFAEAAHVRPLGLGGASDATLWAYAAEHGYVLVTKDEDFLGLSTSRGFPPKVVCLAIGNASNAITVQFLLSHSEEITRFVAHPEAGFLLLERSG